MTELEKLKMDDKYINQNDIVKRYLQSKLTPEETMEFEEYILDKPELLERLELDMVLVETLPAVSENHKVSLGKKIEPRSSIWRVLFDTPIKASLGTGLACVMAMLLLLPVIQNQVSPIDRNLELIYLSDVRSDSFEQIFDVTPSTETFIFVLELNHSAAEPFSVNLINQDTGQPLTLLSSYTPNSDGEIYVSVHASEIPTGNYSFEYNPMTEPHKKYQLLFKLD